MTTTPEYSREERMLLEEKYDGSVKSEAIAASFATDKERLASGEPLAYVIGWQPFLGLRIYLDSKPLIPRPETEWIAEKLIAHLGTFAFKKSGHAKRGDSRTFKNELTQVRILDLCAGSGAIGCAILKEVPETQVSFGELMPEHEVTIKKNISENSLDAARADIRIGDLFAPFTEAGGSAPLFDVIVSNPPYIPDDRALDASVAAHEPAEALRGGPDGLDIIRRIADEAPQHLEHGGELWLEVDAEHAEAARMLVEASLGRAELYPDLYGRPRLVVGHYD